MEIDNIYFIDKSKNVKNENTKQICDFEQYLRNIYRYFDENCVKKGQNLASRQICVLHHTRVNHKK